MLFNPSHPGEVLKEYLGDMTVKEAARRSGKEPSDEHPRSNRVPSRPDREYHDHAARLWS